MPHSNQMSLREYVDVRFSDQENAVAAALRGQEKAVSAALAAAKEAVIKAETASEKRFEGVNEFRAALSDQGRLMMPRAEAEQAFKAINDKLDLLTARVVAREERAVGMVQFWGILIGAVGLISAAIAIVYALSSGP